MANFTQRSQNKICFLETKFQTRKELWIVASSLNKMIQDFLKTVIWHLVVVKGVERYSLGLIQMGEIPSQMIEI